MRYDFPTVLDFGLEPAAEVLTRGFADYHVRAPFRVATLVQMIRTDSVDPAVSRVVCRDGVALGVALIARRGWTSRLAAMAIVPEARRSGAGRAVLERVLAEAQARGDRTMILEVIEQNEPAVRLYETAGFHAVRRLVGGSGAGAGAESAARMTEEDPRDLAALVGRDGLPDLPWQLSGETLAHLAPPAVVYRLEGAWVAIADREASPATIRALITEHGRRRQGRATALLRAVMARHPGKEWRFPAIWPEELVGVFARVGLRRGDISQWQMVRAL